MVKVDKNHNIKLVWEPPTDIGGSEIAHYIIKKRDAKRNTWSIGHFVDGHTTTFAFQKLLEGHNHFFRVSAQNDNCTSEPAITEESTTAKYYHGEFPESLHLVYINVIT